MTKTTHPPLMIRCGNESGESYSKPAGELQVSDLWHLARAFPALETGIKKAKEHLLEEEYGDAEIALNELGVPDGERASEAVLAVWHFAHSQLKALRLVESRLHQVLDLVTEESPARLHFEVKHGISKIVLAALEGAK